jgi:secondary thiamine-phosphate synthase enzyme
MVLKMIYREIIKFETKPNKHIDITDEINEIVKKCQMNDGMCHIYLQATTAGFLLNEHCAMLIGDFQNLYSKLAPIGKLYQHPENAHSHLKASFLKQELSIPVANKKLLLGTWQKILLMEFDTKKRTRSIVVTISE